MKYQVRPLHDWPPDRPAGDDLSPFSASWRSTEQVLDRELWKLRASSVVVELDVTEGQVKRDGTLHGQRSNTATSRVALAFDTPDGPMIFRASRFRDWRDNLRAIALGLEALRKVDRYGITSRAEQYAGWRQLNSARAVEAMDHETALKVIADLADRTPDDVTDDLPAALRLAVFAAHPDHGGTDEAFVAYEQARQVLTEGNTR